MSSADSNNQDGQEVLPLGKIRCFIHSFQVPNEQLPEDHCVRVQYGRISDRIFKMSREVSSLKLEGNEDEMTHPINLMVEFQYRPGDNFLQFEVVNRPTGRQVLCKIIPLLDLPFNQFNTRRILVQAKNSQNTLGADTIQMHMKVSFFIEDVRTYTADKGSLQTTLATFTRKKPDTVDIFDAQTDLQRI